MLLAKENEQNFALGCALSDFDAVNGIRSHFFNSFTYVSTGTSYGSNAFATPKPRCIPILTHANDDRSEIKYANPYKNCINAINIR